MKKTTLLLLCLLSMTAVAQDIIVTKDAKRIDAKVLEVSATEIKYKKFTYQDGPTFIISIADVSSVLYENGDVQVYGQQSEKDAQVPEQVKEPQVAVPVQRKQIVTQQIQTISTEKKSEKNYTTETCKITCQDEYYYLRCGENFTRMDKKAYLRYIEMNCPDAWQSYQKGTKLWNAGWGLFGAGLGVELLIGVPMYAVGLNKIYSSGNASQAYGGVAFIAIGSLMTLGSIPLLAVGAAKRNNSHEVFNEGCAKQQVLTLNLQAGTNGIGLALNF